MKFTSSMIKLMWKLKKSLNITQGEAMKLAMFKCGDVGSTHLQCQKRRGVAKTQTWHASAIKGGRGYYSGHKRSSFIKITKHCRPSLMPWSVLNGIKDESILDFFTVEGGDLDPHTVVDMADLISVHGPSTSFDYPEGDRLRALLGSVLAGYVTIDGLTL